MCVQRCRYGSSKNPMMRGGRKDHSEGAEHSVERRKNLGGLVNHGQLRRSPYRMLLPLLQHSDTVRLRLCCRSIMEFQI
jgi:hypothetical protein